MQGQENNDATCNNNNTILEQIAEVERIIAQDLDPRQTQEYFEALHCVPTRVQLETPVLDFLLTENYFCIGRYEKSFFTKATDGYSPWIRAGRER